jgi:hypothetical protein
MGMKKNVNGKMVDMTPEENAEMVRTIREERMRERARSLDLTEVLALLIPGVINTAQVDDNTALRMRSYYPQWQSGADYTVGYKVQHNDRLWRCRQAHSAITGWEPPNVASLWEQVCESHTGAEDDPIPYEGNMALIQGLYYVQDGVWYRCIRDTGNPVYHALRDLVGLYVEVIG